MKLFFALLPLFIVCSCSNKQSQITHAADYTGFLNNKERPGLVSIDKQLEHWSARLKKDSGDLVARSIMAGLYARRFSYSGDVAELRRATDWYKEVNKINKYSGSSTFRSLATVCISQHQFRLAKSYLDSALAMGDDKLRSLLLMSDVQLELGESGPAIQSLNKVEDQQGFEVLIRRAKIQDKVYGRLDNAINILEQAAAKDEVKSNTFLYNWIYSNLGDMYGHAGRYRQAYSSYLSVLKNDPAYYHCLKGIAWLAFSHDHDAAGAKKILEFLISKQPLPDYDLMMASISREEGNKKTEEEYIAKYQSKLNSGMYGAMYNAYTCKLYLDAEPQPEKALAIAEEEVKQRPTALSYSLLSWALLANGKKQEALQIARCYVEGRTAEPDAIYRLGILYSVLKEKQKAEKYLKQAREGSYELGPSIEKNIDATLHSI